MVKLITLFIASFLIGSIPTAYIYCKFRGKDIRKEGSKNVGATNAGRLFGKSAFFVVFFLDALKGFLPVYFFPKQLPYIKIEPEILAIIFLFFTVFGHIWTIFLKFKGGKGVATSVGGLIAIMPFASLLTFVVFAIVFFITKMVALGSILAAICLPVLVFFIYHSVILTIFSFLLGGLIIFTHRSNIKRMLEGTELKIKKT